VDAGADPGRARARRSGPAAARRRRRLEREGAGRRADRHQTLVGGDPFATRAALLDKGLVTSAIPTSRSDDLDRPVLRVSTAPWIGQADLEALVRDLAAATK
jgi:hypothetical protein